MKHHSISSFKFQVSSFLTLAALLAYTLPVSAQRLSITQQTVDIGRTGYQIPVTATFEMRNKGLRKLVIQDIKPDCNCTKVEFPKGEIGIGERFFVKMTYDARMLGHFNKQAAVFTNASKTPAYITMTGIVLADLQDYSGNYPHDFNGLLVDRDEIEFDDIHKGEKPIQELRIMNNTAKTMHPNLLHLPSYLTATISPQKLNPGHSGKITLTLNSEKVHDYGLTQTSVYLAQQLGEKVKSETLIGVSVVLLPSTPLNGATGVVSVHNSPQLALSDTTLNISFDGKPKKSVEIVLSNHGDAMLHISALQMFTPGLKVTLSKRNIDPGESTKLKITAFADQLAKIRKPPRVLMITNDPHYQKVIITVKTNNL